MNNPPHISFPTTESLHHLLSYSIPKKALLELLRIQNAPFLSLVPSFPPPARHIQTPAAWCICKARPHLCTRALDVLSNTTQCVLMVPEGEAMLSSLCAARALGGQNNNSKESNKPPHWNTSCHQEGSQSSRGSWVTSGSAVGVLVIQAVSDARCYY